MPKGSWREFDDAQKAIKPNPTETQPDKSNRQVRITKVRNGKKGKSVTLIRGLELSNNEARELLKLLKAKCSTGGTVKEGSIELQGDQIEMTMEILFSQGFRPKKAGGN